jgi:DNA topoisomerase-1
LPTQFESVQDRYQALQKKYTLLVTEKPDAANRIATALDTQGKPKKAFTNGVPYYEAYRDGNIVVVPALGHLYTVTSKERTRDYPVFDYQWVPRYMAEKGASRIRTWLKAIADLAKDADAFVNGCDYDIEGSIIGYTILKYACGEKHPHREGASGFLQALDAPAGF